MYKKHKLELANILEELMEHLKLCDPLPSSELRMAEVTAGLEKALLQLKATNSVDTRHLAVLFAPTGYIQEWAIAHGWDAAYLKLAKRFDELIPQLKGRPNRAK